MILFYYIYNNCKSNRDTVIVVKRVFSLAKTIVVDVIVIYFLLWADQNRFRKCVSDLIQMFCRLSADRLNFLKLSELRIRNGRSMFPGILVDKYIMRRNYTIYTHSTSNKH